MTWMPLDVRADAPAGLFRAIPVAAVLLGSLAAGLIATSLNPLIAVSLAGGTALLLLSLRWPLLPLFVFVALIPIEDTVRLEGVGTLSRLVGMLFAAVYVAHRLSSLIPGALPIAGWIYLAWALLSAAWAVDPTASVDRLQTLIQMAVIGFLVANVVIEDPTRVRPILWVYSASATATAAIGIVSYLAGGFANDTRLAAIAGQNPAQFASLLLPAAIFGLHELLSRRHIAASALVVGLCSIGIVLSGTRSVWLAAAVAVLFVLLPQIGRRRAGIALGVLGVLALVTYQVPGVAGLIAERSTTAVATGGAGRSSIWAVGLEILESSPLIGVGYGNFMSTFTSEAIRSANVRFDYAGAAPHSIAVSTAVELGAVGLVILALFVVPLVFRRGWGPDSIVVQAVLASLLMDALFIDIFGYRKQVWIAIGLACGLAYLAKQATRRRLVEPMARAVEPR